MATRHSPLGWTTRALAFVEQLGRVLELALTALMLPVGRAALWLGRLLQRLLSALRTRAPRPPGNPYTPNGPGQAPATAQRRETELSGGPTGQDTADKAPATQPPHDVPGDDERGGDGRDPGAKAAPEPSPRRRRAWRVGAVYVLVVLSWAVLTIMRRVDSALQQMEVGGQSAGSALGFPVSLSHVAESLGTVTAQATVTATREAWLGYQTGVAGTTVLRDPFDVAQSLVLLDLCFIFLYGILLAIALLTLGRLNARTPGRADMEQQRLRRTRMLYGAGGVLAVLLLVDLLEDWQIQRALVGGDPLTQLSASVALGPLMSLLKIPLTLGVLGPALFVALSLAVRSRPLRAALVNIRGVLYAVAGLALVFMVGIGAAQVDDVIRAWDGWRAAWSVIACFALSVTVAGVARLLSSSGREHPAPDVGRTAQPLLLGSGAILIVAGQILRVAGLGWGVSVAGAILVALWAFGLPIDGLPHWPALPPRLRPHPRWVVVSVTAAIGGVVGAVLAPLLGWVVPPGVVLGVVGALAALAGWSLRSDTAAEDRPGDLPAGAGVGADALELARSEADLAFASQDRALAAASRGDVPGWLGHARAAATHAAKAERHAEEAQAAVYAAATVTPEADLHPGEASRAAAAAVTPEADLHAAETAAHAAAALAAAARQAARSAGEAGDAEAVAVWGDRLGRVAGSAVAAVLVVAIARAIALDTYVRESPSWRVIGWPLVGAVLAGVVGLGVCTYRARRVGGAPLAAWTTAWFWFTVLSLAGGLWILQDAYAVPGAQAGGSVAVLLGGFTLLIGVLALAAAGVRRGPITRYALAPALRVLRFRRFPVLLFLLIWAVGVSALDSGGYHDIRRSQVRPATAVAPTIGQAWQQYVQAVPRGAPQPVVLVGAQGGGIRAAVWTALVMECIFGPGPVTGSGDLCAEGEREPDLQRMATAAAAPQPVFLASGASGGSVGLAAWSARRGDLVQDGPSTSAPRTVEEALDLDFVAPDVARLLLADLPHALLAWDLADRAEMLERAWERAWHDRYRSRADAAARGLNRGLRQLWDVTHANGAWTTPVLALNGISVEDDCRFVASAVDFTLPRQLPANPADPRTAVDSRKDRPDDAACRGVGSQAGDAVDVLSSTSELIDYLCPAEDVPLSTAAHISARFPYVSPTGRVERRACAGPDAGLVPQPAISYDADGGIFDNAGSGTAVDAWRALAPLAAATERTTGTCLVPVFVQIDNSPGRATVSSAADPRPSELTAPIAATMGQLSSREAYSRSGAAAAFGYRVSAGGQHVSISGVTASGPLWFRIVLYGQPGPEPPLGWTLAPQTVKDMRSQLMATPNQEQIKTLRTILRSGSLSCTER